MSWFIVPKNIFIISFILNIYLRVFVHVFKVYYIFSLFSVSNITSTFTAVIYILHNCSRYIFAYVEPRCISRGILFEYKYFWIDIYGFFNFRIDNNYEVAILTKSTVFLKVFVLSVVAVFICYFHNNFQTFIFVVYLSNISKRKVRE